MNDNLFLTIATVFLLAAAGVWMLRRGMQRHAHDVLEDLSDDADGVEDSANAARVSNGSLRVGGSKLILDDELGKVGLFEKTERARFKSQGVIFPITFAFGAIILRLITNAQADPAALIMAALTGLSLGYLVARGRLPRRKARYVHSLEFFLPVVMERLVMAVQAGLDILAAIKSIVELERSRGVKLDPVTRLLEIVLLMTESGLGFDNALNQIASVTDCPAVRHAFIHLAIAYEEGGELVMPLKELSDSTQLYYQESIDEQIAKLPVKATVPLIVTFAGLLLCFMTVPIVQVVGFSKDAIKNMDTGEAKR